MCAGCVPPLHFVARRHSDRDAASLHSLSLSCSEGPSRHVQSSLLTRQESASHRERRGRSRYAVRNHCVCASRSDFTLSSPSLSLPFTLSSAPLLSLNPCRALVPHMASMPVPGTSSARVGASSGEIGCLSHTFHPCYYSAFDYVSLT